MFAADVAQQFLVPFQLVFRVQAPLHQDLVAADLDGLADFVQQHVAVQHPALVALRAAVERAKVTDRRADVRVVNVPVDVVRPITLRVRPPGDRVGGGTDVRQPSRPQQRHRVFVAQTSAVDDAA